MILLLMVVWWHCMRVKCMQLTTATNKCCCHNFNELKINGKKEMINQDATENKPMMMITSNGSSRSGINEAATIVKVNGQ